MSTIDVKRLGLSLGMTEDEAADHSRVWFKLGQFVGERYRMRNLLVRIDEAIKTKSAAIALERMAGDVEAVLAETFE